MNQFKILERAGLPQVPRFIQGQRVFIVRGKRNYFYYAFFLKSVLFKAGDMKKKFEKAEHETVQKEVFVIKEIVFTEPRPSYILETLDGAQRLRGSIPEHSLRPATSEEEDEF